MRPSARLLTLAANLRLSIPEQSIRRAELYRSLGAASPEVIRLAGLGPGPFGHQAESILISRLGLKHRLSTEHDAICPSTGLRVEIKCARFALSSTPKNLKYSWTRVHSEPYTMFEMLILGLLTVHGFEIITLDNHQVKNLLTKKQQTRYFNNLNSSRVSIFKNDITKIYNTKIKTLIL